jgi:DNA (cytosine-5)-methyltransferase 1
MGSNISNTITSVQKDSLVAEPNVLTPKRTDFGKQVRKQYESGELDMSRHDMTELEPRTDGVSNTLTSVQKDNLVAEPIIIDDYNQRIPENQDVIGTITTNVGNSAPRNGFKIAEPIIIDDYNQRVPQDQDVIGTVTTQFGNPAPRHGYKIAEPLRIPQATKQGYIEVPQGAVFDMSYPESTTRRGRVQEGGQVSPTLMAGGEAPCHYEGKESTSYRIRKLTPRECFRLMGVTEADIDKIQQSGVSQSQQYKMAGNSIVVDVLYHIFRKLFVITGQESQQLSLF